VPLFQPPPRTPEEVERSRPLDVGPEQVLLLDEREWYARVYRGDDAPQLTVRAVVMGCVLGFFLAFTNLYVGLVTGWYLAVAITACILSYSIWTSFVGVGLAKTPMSILENNCMQSCASCAGYGTGSTIITAIPAILMLSVTPADPRGHNLPWWVVGSWALVLGVLGVALAIPMKRNLINREKLRFPEGTAAAVMLQSLLSHGAEALAKARVLYGGAIVGALTAALTTLNVGEKKEPLLPDSIGAFDWLPKVHGATFSQWTLRFNLSFLLVGAGAIMGLRVSASMLLGALLLIVFIGPAALDWTWTNPAGDLVGAATSPSAAWRQIGIWCGAPLMIAYGLTTLAGQGALVARAFRGVARGASSGDADDAVARKVEVPPAWFAALAGVSAVAAVIMARAFFDIPIGLGVLAVAMTFALTIVAARATGETSVTPVGPLGKIMQLTYGILMPQNVVANLMTASISANASGSCADLLNDLKVGYLLGANPRRQFLAQLFGVVTGSIATTLGYFLLVPDASVLTGEGGHEPRFAAPGAQQWKAVADLFKVGISSLHPMARDAIYVGLALGVAVGVVERLAPRVKGYLPSATAIGLGLMLPASVPLAFFVGAVGAALLEKAKPDLARKYVVPASSGVIAGESILAVLIAGMNNVFFK
jgi:putative OPT family oligopeptide transporter